MGTRETMDFKSTIFIFGAVLIFILPLVISAPISGEGGVGGDRSSLTNSSNFTNQMQVKNTTETSLNVADNSNDTDEIVNGQWGSWSNYGYYSTCTKSCGSGTQRRTRQCNNPPPSNGGSYCVGDAENTRQCNTESCPEQDMIPYSTVQSGTCESEGMRTIMNKEECVTILNAMKKFGFGTVYSYTNSWTIERYKRSRYEQPLPIWHSLFLPFGCLFNDNGSRSGMSPIIWNPTLSFQKSLPCGSVWNGHKYNCFCKK